MRYLFALPLAAVGVMAVPAGDACLAAVTGKAALGDDSLRSAHCASFLATTVTPPAITTTVTVTGIDEDKKGWAKRASVTYCPNEVPNYASACDEAHYTSACSKFGITKSFTTTLDPRTTTKTVYVHPGATCDATATETETVTDAGKTVTVGSGPATTITATITKGVVTSTLTSTVTDKEFSNKTTTVTETETETKTTTLSPAPTNATDATCLTDVKAKELVDAFVNFLEFTSYNGTRGAPGRGYNQELSDKTLTPDFVDISDSINLMAGFPLGSITFPNKVAFDIGQGQLQPEVGVKILNIWHDCHSITWRWKISPLLPGAFPVVGINYMIITDNFMIKKNYAEFDNAAWLQSFGRQCATTNITVAGSDALRRNALPAY